MQNQDNTTLENTNLNTFCLESSNLNKIKNNRRGGAKILNAGIKKTPRKRLYI